ncbi:MAG TPA: hypothetical protein VFJ19_15000 [Nocardioidaceae bacterium]|nr:hypothetical protein [Nocardioidaceae bacterium]
MSLTLSLRDRARRAPRARRVRHEVKDGMAVVVFSAAASTGLALALLVLTRLAGVAGR